MIIPFKSLEPSVLKAIIEEFVSREGSDYGEVEYSFESKIEAVKKQLEEKKIYIVFSEELETPHILSHRECVNNGLL